MRNHVRAGLLVGEGFKLDRLDGGHDAEREATLSEK